MTEFIWLPGKSTPSEVLPPCTPKNTAPSCSPQVLHSATIFSFALELMPLLSRNRGLCSGFSKPSETKAFNTSNEGAKTPVFAGVFSTTSLILLIIVWYMAGVLFSMAVVTPRQTRESTCSLGNGDGKTVLMGASGSLH